MSSNPDTTFEDAIRDSGEGWLIDWFTPPSAALEHIRQILGEVDKLARERLVGNAPSVSETSLMAHSRSNPLQVKGFFQALGICRTPEILLMVWRIIQGMELKSIRLEYDRQQEFRLHVVLESPYGEADLPYTSNNIDDFKVFRHIGIMKIGDSPVFDGFYALKLRD